MKILAIIGKSGCGKTTLASILEKIRPSDYKRIIQYTTRGMRENEKDGIDYHFITRDYFLEELKEDPNFFTCKVMTQFKPSLYGTKMADLDPKKNNVVIASIEGILDLLSFFKPSQIKILHITNVDNAEVVRTDGRNADLEQSYSDIVLDGLKNIKQLSGLQITNISHEKLKNIRNNSKDLWEFMKKHKLK